MLDSHNCLAFQQTVTVSVASTQTWLTTSKITFDYMDVNAQMKVEMTLDGSEGTCAEVTLRADIQPLAHANANYDISVPSFYKLVFMKGC